MLFETICYQNGKFQRLSLHEARMNDARKRLFGCTEEISLAEHLESGRPEQEGTFKCRVNYSRIIENVNFEPYFPKQVDSLKLIEDNNIDYSFKYKNREHLERLFQSRGDADDVIIVKKGWLTDTTYANIILLRKGKWYTPRLPLLPGTRRLAYLQSNLIIPEDIRPEDLVRFDEIRIINAMISMETSPQIRPENIC
ncbi:MAG: aminotransferase class IV [Marinilabiliales bacterium]|nr:aminotransferase class IV [Marinilabiliales bacterium]